eukprot:6400765-Amphidinium_carterae.1
MLLQRSLFERNANRSALNRPRMGPMHGKHRLGRALSLSKSTFGLLAAALLTLVIFCVLLSVELMDPENRSNLASHCDGLVAIAVMALVQSSTCIAMH